MCREWEKKTLIYLTTAELRYLPLQSTDRELSVINMICLIPDSKSPQISYFKACLVVSLYSFFFNRFVGSNFQLSEIWKRILVGYNETFYGKMPLFNHTKWHFCKFFFSPDSAWMPTICITYHAAVEEKLMKNLSLGHLLIHKTRQPAA